MSFHLFHLLLVILCHIANVDGVHVFVLGRWIIMMPLLTMSIIHFCDEVKVRYLHVQVIHPLMVSLVLLTKLKALKVLTFLGRTVLFI